MKGLLVFLALTTVVVKAKVVVISGTETDEAISALLANLSIAEPGTGFSVDPEQFLETLDFVLEHLEPHTLLIVGVPHVAVLWNNPTQNRHRRLMALNACTLRNVRLIFVYDHLFLEYREREELDWAHLPVRPPEWINYEANDEGNLELVAQKYLHLRSNYFALWLVLSLQGMLARSQEWAQLLARYKPADYNREGYCIDTGNQWSGPRIVCRHGFDKAE